MAILLPVLLVSMTGCRSSEQTAEGTAYQDALRNMVPALPEVPSFPALDWQYRDGMYCLTENDVDLFLDYRENALPIYIWEMQQYRKKMDAILESF